MFEILALLVAGLIIGLLGKLVAPGDKDNVPIWLTILCGIGGVLLGTALASAMGVANTPRIDWIRWAISIALAAVLVIAASTLTGRNTRRSI
ncbi:MAG: GlsB/YeaQ/YmgE family stress response membrane protein [Actinomycetota bacterium]|nr:GlsB/YeaQ/YmgE family stress response membrane protein [Actinomycetota bacterium]